MPGLPHADPKGPTAGHNRAPHPRWQRLRKARGREGKHRTAGGGEGSGVRNGPAQMAKRGEGAARVVLAVKISLKLVQRPCWSRYSCCSHEEPHTGADVCIMNAAAVHGKDSCGSKGESVKREVLLWTDHNPYCPCPYISQRR